MDQPDATWRGISVFRTSIEATRKLLEGDPALAARRMEADVFTWLMPAGSLGDKPAAQISEP